MCDPNDVVGLSCRRFLTRKDVARILEISVKSVQNNEQRLGLDLARRDINGRYIRYVTPIALAELRKRKQLPEPPANGKS